MPIAKCKNICYNISVKRRTDQWDNWSLALTRRCVGSTGVLSKLLKSGVNNRCVLGRWYVFDQMSESVYWPKLKKAIAKLKGTLRKLVLKFGMCWVQVMGFRWKRGLEKMLDTKSEDKWPLIGSRAIKGHLFFCVLFSGGMPSFFLQKCWKIYWTLSLRRLLRL